MFFVEFSSLNSCITLRSITFTKEIFFHSLMLTLWEKHILFWIWGDAFFGTPGKRLWFLNIRAHSALRMSYIGLRKYLFGLCIQYKAFYILWQKKSVPQKYKFCVLINVGWNKCHWRSIRVNSSGEFIMESNIAVIMTLKNSLKMVTSLSYSP